MTTSYNTAHLTNASSTNSQGHSYQTKTTDTESAPAVFATQVQDDDEEKQGQKCCHCCCDYRRAVIIVNVIIAILEALVLLLVATGFLGEYLYGSEANLLGNYETMEIVFSCVSILLSGLAIAGAFLYNVYMVATNVVWLVVGFALGIYFVLQYCNDMLDYCDAHPETYYSCTCYLNFPNVVIAGIAMCLWIYPHVGFIQEVRKGIMSKETYQREQYSCCCV